MSDAGAENVVVGAFDADVFRLAIVFAKPDVVVHQIGGLDRKRVGEGACSTSSTST